jgi:alkylhydroperoxidase family enzyme
MRISLVEKDQAPPVVQKIYEALQLHTGSVAPYFKVLAHKPDVMRAFNQLHAAVLADGALPAKLKDLAYLRVAILSGCEY